MVPNRKILLPVLLWTLLWAGVFVGAILQQQTGIEWVPGLSLSNVFGWVGAALVLYLLVFWPISLQAMVERFARQQLRQGTFIILGLMEPTLLILYGLPVLVTAASFGDKGVGAILQALLLFAAIVLATLAHFHLGFYFHGNMAKPYFLVMGGLCVWIPLVDLAFRTLYGSGPEFFNQLNPFFAVFSLASQGGATTETWLTPVLVFGGLGLTILAFPILTAMPLRVYEDHS
jgi:hypothetical protein